MAVLTYLRRILESLDHPDMINLILHYLLALPDNMPSHKTGQRTSISAARKRKSMDLASMMAEKSETSVTPLLFNLVDLILACLRSRNQQTIHVTLQLVSAILKRHHRYAIITLLKTEVLPAKTINRTIGAHEQEVEYLMSLAGSIGGQDNFDETYENVLKDTMSRLENHPCSLKLVAPKVSTNNHKLPEIPDSLPGAPRDVREHTLRPDDPLLNAMVDLLETFFVNAVETNLGVTETLIDLAICGYMSIEGWLARGPNSYSYVDDEVDVASPTSEDSEPTAGVLEGMEPLSDEAERLKAMERCRRRPKWNQSSVPRMLDVLKRLCDQVETYKGTIPRFEELVQQRRDAFQTADSILDNPIPARRGTPAQFETPERPSLEELSRSGSPARPSAIEGFAQRLLSELGTPSRSGSPRGRKEQSRSSGTSTPGGHMATPKALAPREFPLNYNDPGRSGIARSRSPASARGDGEGRDILPPQAAAFAAVDQSILSRRVGLPDEKVNPIPLRFDKKPMPEPIEPAKDEEEGEDGEKEDAGAAAEVAEDYPDTAETTEAASADGTVSVSHVVTNVIIFQSFVLELASLIQVRAGLFDEVRFV